MVSNGFQAVCFVKPHMNHSTVKTTPEVSTTDIHNAPSGLVRSRFSLITREGSTVKWQIWSVLSKRMEAGWEKSLPPFFTSTLSLSIGQLLFDFSLPAEYLHEMSLKCSYCLTQQYLISSSTPLSGCIMEILHCLYILVANSTALKTTE